MTEIARQKFDELFAEYELSENDAAWSVFKAGWDQRASFEYELDLQLATLESENNQLRKQLQELRGPNGFHKNLQH